MPAGPGDGLRRTGARRPAWQGVVVSGEFSESAPPVCGAPEDDMKKFQKGMTLMQMLVLIGAIGVAVAIAVSYLR